MYRVLKTLCYILLFWEQSSALSVMIQSSQVVTKIGFGSCLNPTKSFQVLKTIGSRKPNIFLMLGDITYSDTLDPLELTQDYRRLKQRPQFQFFTQQTSRILGVWDDHDYGLNDMGGEHPNKNAMKKVFWEFYERPYTSTLQQRSGVYQSLISGKAPNRVQIVLLDTRFNRSSLKKSEGLLPGKLAIVPNSDPNAQMLGEEQWRWFQKQLTLDVNLRIIVSSVQVINQYHPYEKWHNFPKEHDRLLKLIHSNISVPTLLLTGDRHFHELSKLNLDSSSSIYEFTSSGLNVANPKSGGENNLYRVRSSNENGFGWIEVNWQDRTVKLSFVGEKGKSSEWLSKPLSLLNSPQ